MLRRSSWDGSLAAKVLKSRQRPAIHHLMADLVQVRFWKDGLMSGRILRPVAESRKTADDVEFRCPVHVSQTQQPSRSGV